MIQFHERILSDAGLFNHQLEKNPSTMAMYNVSIH